MTAPTTPPTPSGEELEADLADREMEIADRGGLRQQGSF